MAKTNPNDCAFSSDEALGEKYPNHFDARNGFSGGGLTKREYFAAMAMQACIRKYTNGYYDAVQHAIEYADNLIEQLNKKETP